MGFVWRAVRLKARIRAIGTGSKINRISDAYLNNRTTGIIPKIHADEYKRISGFMGVCGNLTAKLNHSAEIRQIL